jgi:class 3 adenylate cyclase
MFIDIVGFSLSSENMAPRDAFTNLKAILMRISEIVHEHGGIIDKTLGDGLLAYFGYRFDSDETNSNHPEAALRCAIKIQEQMLEESLLAARASSPIYPLRIGLNTASCFLGDLGSGRRIEFTVVGNGVNFAKRLESACRVFCVMIGSTTYELVKGLPWSEGIFARKVMKIKHHSDLRDAVEVNPLRLRETEVSEVLDAFNAQAILHRAAERMHVRDVGSVFVETSAGRGSVLDFTGSGVSVLFDSPRTRGDVLEIRFDSRIQGLMKELDEHGIRALEAEVRWSHAAAEGFVHGLVFKNLRTDQQELFVRVLSSYAFSGFKAEDGERDESSSMAS